MAVRKKAKRKTRAKRKKGRATKPAGRRKTATATVKRKRAKKAPSRRTSPKKAAARRAPPATAAVKPPPARPVADAGPTPSPPAQHARPEERIGVVTHYYNHLSVATLRLDSGTLRVGDVVHIFGHTTDFTQTVESLEVEHSPVSEVGPGQVFGLKVIGHAREHDAVYKVPQ